MDVLGLLCGANIVGRNKEPSKFFPEMLEKKDKKIVQHKARVFDDNSYYYKISENPVQSKQKNVTANSMIIANEFKNQISNFLKDFDIKQYLGKKRMIQEYQKGKILKSLSLKSDERSLV